MKNRTKMLIVLVCILAAIISSVICVLSVGSSYTFHTNTFLGTDQTPNEELVFEFKALTPGRTTVNISYECDDAVIPMCERTFEVNSFGTLIDCTDGNIRFNGFAFIVYAALSVLFVIQFMTLWIFSDYLKKGDFSYPMIACGGIGICGRELCCTC